MMEWNDHHVYVTIVMFVEGGMVYKGFLVYFVHLKSHNALLNA